MSRHDLDLASLSSGLVFLVGGGTVLLSRTTDVHGSWVLAATLLALGVAAIVGGAVRMVRGSSGRDGGADGSGTGVSAPDAGPTTTESRADAG